MKKVEELGIYVKAEEGKLYTAKTLESGRVELGEDQKTPNWSEVTKPESQEWLDTVNKALHTDFTLGNVVKSVTTDNSDVVSSDSEPESQDNTDDDSNDSDSSDE